jgi:PEP-CTERM motif-containing protein
MSWYPLQLCAVSAALVASPVAAVTIGYGDCQDFAGGGTVVYQQVTESNSETTGLYGAPACVQNLIDFDPIGFEARDTNGGDAAADSILGMLDFTIQATVGTALTHINVNEGGDRLVFDSAPSATEVSATMTVALSIYVSDGGGGELAVAYTDTQVALFTIPASSTFVPVTWSLDADFALSQILDEACLGVGQYSGNVVPEACGASTSKVAVHVDNLLESLLDGGGISVINKKETESLSITTLTVPIPEPATAALLGLGLLGLATSRRRR